jgi:hypothetical protein
VSLTKATKSLLVSSTPVANYRQPSKFIDGVTATSVDLGKHLNTGVIDTSSKFADSINNTGSPIANGFINTGGEYLCKFFLINLNGS